MSDIKVTIGGDASGFSNALAMVKREGSSLYNTFRAPLAGLSFVGMGLAAKSLIDEMDNIGDEADKLGVGTKFFQELGNAAKVSGSSVEEAAKSASKLATTLTLAKDGDEVSKALESIGLSSKNLASLPLEQKYKAVAKAISEQADQSTKMAVATKLMGKAGAALIPTLETLASGQGVAGIFPDESIRNAQKFNDWITTTSQNLKSNFVKGVELAKDALTGDLFTDPLNKKKQKAEAEDTKKKEAAAQAAAIAKAALDEADAKEKADKATDKAINKIKTEKELLDMKNSGLEKEAEIKKQIADIEEKTGRKLTDTQRSAMTDATGALYDAKNSNFTSPALPSQAGFTSLRSMGANLPSMYSAEGRNLDKERNALLKKIADIFSKSDTSYDSKRMTEIMG